VLAYSFYDRDSRIIRYAQSLVRRGDSVDSIGLGHQGQPRHSVVDGVNVYRIQTRERNEQGKWTYLARILAFFVRSTLFLARKHHQQPYDLVHVHSVPDFEVFAAWVPKLSGVPLVLDIHDLMPEFYASKFGYGDRHPVCRILRLVEKMSTGFADHVIIANDIWRETLTARSVHPDKCTAFINYVDRIAFSPHPRARSDNKLIAMYHGGLQRHQGLDVAVRALARVRADLPEIEFHIYGEGSAHDELLALVQDFDLQHVVLIKGHRPASEIPDIIANADLGIVPKRADIFGNEAYSTKVLEFMSMGIPVILSRTAIDTFYFNDSVVRFFKPGDVEDLAAAIRDLAIDPAARRDLAARAATYAEENSWQKKQHDYLALVDSLVARRKGKHAGGGRSK